MWLSSLAVELQTFSSRNSGLAGLHRGQFHGLELSPPYYDAEQIPIIELRLLCARHEVVDVSTELPQPRSLFALTCVLMSSEGPPTGCGGFVVPPTGLKHGICPKTLTPLEYCGVGWTPVAAVTGRG